MCSFRIDCVWGHMHIEIDNGRMRCHRWEWGQEERQSKREMLKWWLQTIKWLQNITIHNHTLIAYWPDWPIVYPSRFVPVDVVNISHHRNHQVWNTKWYWSFTRMWSGLGVQQQQQLYACVNHDDDDNRRVYVCLCMIGNFGIHRQLTVRLYDDQKVRGRNVKEERNDKKEEEEITTCAAHVNMQCSTAIIVKTIIK